MRKIIFLIHVSLDGFTAGPNGEMDWIVYNAEMERYSHSLHATTDAAIYGRVTYQMMKSYWPNVLTDPAETDGARDHARWLESATKIVASRTLDRAEWKGSVLIKDNLEDAIAKLKAQPGKDMWLLGSPTLAQELMRANLIDEYRLNVNPVLLGAGKSLFGGLTTPPKLTLIDAQTMPGGVVALRYEPVR